MTTRAYGQNCGLARALDIVGERWTLLLLRELAMGPRRHKDLTVSLSGMGTNLLSRRLQALESVGVVEKVVLPPPASVQAYALTRAGEELRASLAGLAAWGLRHGEPFDDADRSRPEWLIQAFYSAAYCDVLAGLSGQVQIEIDNTVAWVDHGLDVPALRDGPSPLPPSVVITSDIETMLMVIQGHMTVKQAMETTGFTVEGDRQWVRRVQKLTLPAR